ncbi:DUF1592 domain-containing protein [Planctomicrobium sp. SH527]|uniref:DUF1592 domain-containing protein n=1 Tax=Planctomicrobium sp. SH527 TaxID=3448123 RepID=UPI003F5B09F0
MRLFVISPCAFLNWKYPVLLTLLSLVPVLSGSSLLADDVAAGAKLYQEKCARCHGANGEGTEDYSTPLIGDRSILELAHVIAQTMPEDTEKKTSEEESRLISAFMHEKFYSILAQERNRPATVELSRLTVRQYENTVTDLIGSFRWGAGVPKEFGLKAEYYNLRSFKKEKLVIERVDPAVSFQFGETKPEGFPTEPDMEKRKADDIHDNAEFSIKWNGSILIPETGDYEFIVESENGIRLNVNNWKTPIIDAWVRSGNDTVYRKTVKLIGGRSYPLGLNFFRYKEKSASVVLKWKRPGHVEEVIPQRFLTPQGSPEMFVLQTPFPPDDRSIGYERGSSISKAWQDAVTLSALETSQYVIDQLNSLTGIKSEMSGEEKTTKQDEFCKNFVERAFRRPLTEEEVAAYVIAPRKDVPLETGIKRVVLMTLMSPHVLYREIGTFNDFSVASWLSYSLWDSMPDKGLLEAAKKNELHTEEQIRRQVDRMVSDVRARGKLQEFYRQWLQLNHFPEIVKNQTSFPEFSPQLVSDLKSSLEMSIDDMLKEKDADFRQLLTDRSFYVNGRMAKFYGVDLPENSDFQKVDLSSQGRAGVVTHPFMLSGLAYDQESSPIHRGVFVSRGLLGRRLKAPPEAVSPLAPDLHQGLSTRERVILQTSPGACQTCHVMINGLGFPLEHFDAAGRYRELEKEKPVNAVGLYINREGKEISFTGSQELATFLAESPDAHEAFAEQLFTFTIKQPVRAFGQNRLQELAESFEKNQFKVQRLLKEIVVTSALGVQELSKSSTGNAAQVSATGP